MIEYKTQWIGERWAGCYECRIILSDLYGKLKLFYGHWHRLVCFYCHMILSYPPCPVLPPMSCLTPHEVSNSSLPIFANTVVVVLIGFPNLNTSEGLVLSTDPPRLNLKFDVGILKSLFFNKKTPVMLFGIVTMLNFDKPQTWCFCTF